MNKDRFDSRSSRVRPKDDPSDYAYGEYRKYGKTYEDRYSYREPFPPESSSRGNHVLILILVALLVLSAALNVYAVSQLNAYSEKISLDAQWLEYYEECIEFIDANVAFVEDDGSTVFHTFSCDHFGDCAFWAFNTHAAVEQGYLPCSDCH